MDAQVARYLHIERNKKTKGEAKASKENSEVFKSGCFLFFGKKDDEQQRPKVGEARQSP